MTRTILITGAVGNIGAKITPHLRQADYDLRLLDRVGGEGIVAADFGSWDEVCMAVTRWATGAPAFSGQ